MKRSEFIALLAGAAALAAESARAQTAAPPVVGFLNAASAGPSEYLLVAFRAGLREAGLIEGRTVVVEARWAAGDFDRLPGLARELVAGRAAVIATGGGAVVAVTAQSVAGVTPIVFVMGTDPVKAGLVASLGRPGGTITGVLQNTTELASKRFNLLRDAVPGARHFGMLLNPANPNSAIQRSNIERDAARSGVRLTIVDVGGHSPFEPAFEALVRDGVDALLVGADPTFNARRETLVALAARHRLPAMHEWRVSATIGGLMSYGTVLPDMYRQAGGYVARILRGARPADLPIMQASRFELVVNLKTARALGLEIPALILAQADEVIE